MKKRPPSAKKRLKEHREMVLYSDSWARRFASEGDRSLNLLELELKSLEKSRRRVARLETYVKRKSR